MKSFLIRTLTRTLAGTLAIISVATFCFVASGCSGKPQWWEKENDQAISTEPSETTTPAPKDEKTPDFQGFYLKVALDGEITTPQEKTDGEQFWQGQMCTAPQLKFDMGEDYLGQFESVDLLLNPMVDGKPDMKDIWQCNNALTMKPGTPMKFDAFTQIKSGKVIKATSLPAGQYMMTITVKGKNTWDKQQIIVDVK